MAKETKKSTKKTVKKTAKKAHKPVDKPINKYEDFVIKYEGFKKTADALREAVEEEKVTKELVKTAADLYTTPETKIQRMYFLNGDVQLDELCVVLNTGAVQKNAVVAKSEEDLEGIVNDMNDKDVLIGVQISPLRDSYSGKNAKTYQKITDLRKKATEMAEIIETGDVQKMYTEVKEAEDIRLASIDADQKALCDALINAGGNFVQVMYDRNYNETKGEIFGTLEGNEKGYLTANLKDIPFRDFYDGLGEAKIQIQKENQNQGKKSNQNQRKRRR
tara:strand:- start:195 stop:1022 length:828 start_codon:yes stop_codon:yes gene_type:complete